MVSRGLHSHTCPCVCGPVVASHGRACRQRPCAWVETCDDRRNHRCLNQMSRCACGPSVVSHGLLFRPIPHACGPSVVSHEHLSRPCPGVVSRGRPCRPCLCAWVETCDDRRNHRCLNQRRHCPYGPFVVSHGHLCRPCPCVCDPVVASRGRLSRQRPCAWTETCDDRRNRHCLNQRSLMKLFVRFLDDA